VRECIRARVRRPETLIDPREQGDSSMMNGMTNMMEGMGWSMGLVGILIVLLLVLGIAALVKYLFSR
jgi:hypothetical protein